jgi:hypothetical protein
VKSRLEVLPKDLEAPRELVSERLEFNCSHGAEHFERLVKLGRGNTKKAYQARDALRNVTGVLKVPQHAAAGDGTSNVYNLTAREFAHVFHIEARMLAQLRHPNLVRLYGACFDTAVPNRVFTFVEHLRHWAPSLRAGGIAPLRRVAMARGVAELVRTWNHGTNGLGVPLVHCDFLPQQFGLDDADTVKLLDVEGLRELPSNTSAFFFDIKCDSDAVCRRPGCYKGAAQAQHFRDSWPGFDSRAIDEVRCDEQTRRCIGMGVEYNVYAMCRFLLQDLFAPSSMQKEAAALMRGCLEPSLARRWTIDQVIDELSGMQRHLALTHKNER